MKKILLVFFIAFLFLISNNVSFAQYSSGDSDWGNANSNNPNLNCDGDFCYPSNTNLPDSNMKTIVTNLLNWILGIFGMLAVIAFVVSGIQYILSTGDERTMDTAKRNMTYSIIGVVVALSGLIIIFAIDKALRGTSYF